MFFFFFEMAFVLIYDLFWNQKSNLESKERIWRLEDSFKEVKFNFPKTMVFFQILIFNIFGF